MANRSLLSPRSAPADTADGCAITPRPVADVVLDSVQVLEGGQPVSQFRELEAELTGGDEAALARIEERLRAAGATDGDGRPKLLRALGIEPAQTPTPEPSAPAAEHIRAMVAAQLSLITAHDPGTRLGRDPESLHQMRVAVRRLRALLREAGPMLEPGWVDPLRAELEWLGDELGPVRDIDVFRGYLSEEMDRLEPGERPGGGRLLKSLEEERRRARLRLLSALRSERYLRLLAALDEAAGQPRTVDTGTSLESLGERALRRLRRAVRELGDAPSDAALHAVRIKVKRARYAAELAQPVAGKPARRFIERAKQLQDLLGDHQDAVTAQERLRKLADALGDAAASLVAGRLLERQATRRAKLIERFPKRWRKLDKRGRKLWGERRPSTPVRAPSSFFNLTESGWLVETDHDMNTPRVIRAAGGVISRKNDQDETEVLLVHRPHREDWTFPKGKLEPGESAEDCALREVQEETGLRCRLGRELPKTSHVDHKGRLKVVRYWTMQRVSGTARPRTRSTRSGGSAWPPPPIS